MGGAEAVMTDDDVVGVEVHPLVDAGSNKAVEHGEVVADDILIDLHFDIRVQSEVEAESRTNSLDATANAAAGENVAQSVVELRSAGQYAVRTVVETRRP